MGGELAAGLFEAPLCPPGVKAHIIEDFHQPLAPLGLQFQGQAGYPAGAGVLCHGTKSTHPRS